MNDPQLNGSSSAHFSRFSLMTPHLDTSRRVVLQNPITACFLIILKSFNHILKAMHRIPKRNQVFPQAFHCIHLTTRRIYQKHFQHLCNSRVSHAPLINQVGNTVPLSWISCKICPLDSSHERKILILQNRLPKNRDAQLWRTGTLFQLPQQKQEHLPWVFTFTPLLVRETLLLVVHWIH